MIKPHQNPGWQAISVSSGITVGLFLFAKQALPAYSLWLWLTQFSAVLGCFWLCLTYILAIRQPWLDRLFLGLDKAYKAHQLLAKLAFSLLVTHPIWLIINDLPLSTWNLYLLPGEYFPFNLGIMALYLLTTLVVLTLFIKLPYKLWKQTHEWMGVVILLGGAHALLVESDVSRFWPLKIWMAAWLLAALGAYIYKRFLYYFFAPANNYRIKTVEIEKDVVVLTLHHHSHRATLFQPGQFGFISRKNQSGDRNEHPFSVMAITATDLTFGVKVYGAFTQSLTTLKQGDVVTIRGPFGQFGLHTASTHQQIWLAGGIGITPFLSMAQALTPQQKVDLYLVNRGQPPSLFVHRLKTLAKQHPNLVVHYHDSENQGRLTAEKIQSMQKITPKTRVWLCGPPAFMQAFNQQLPTIGIKPQHIYFEDFSLK